MAICCGKVGFGAIDFAVGLQRHWIVRVGVRDVIGTKNFLVVQIISIVAVVLESKTRAATKKLSTQIQFFKKLTCSI